MTPGMWHALALLMSIWTGVGILTFATLILAMFRLIYRTIPDHPFTRKDPPS